MSDQPGTSADYLGPPAPAAHDDERPKLPYRGWAIAALVTVMVVSGAWWVGLPGVTMWGPTNPARRNADGVITEAGRLDLGEIRRGDCVSISGLAESDPTQTLDVTGVPCVEPHNAQALFVVVFPDMRYPGEEAIQQQSRLECASHYAEAGISGAHEFMMFPFEKRWSESGGHRAICFITNGGGRTTGSSLQ